MPVTPSTIPLRLVGLEPSITKRLIGYRWQVTATYTAGGHTGGVTAVGGWARSYRRACRGVDAAKRTFAETLNRDLPVTLRQAGGAS